MYPDKIITLTKSRELLVGTSSKTATASEHMVNESLDHGEIGAVPVPPAYPRDREPSPRTRARAPRASEA